MQLTVVFTENGNPATGLSPVMDGWNLEGTQLLTAATMVEVAGGFYTYDFTGYDYLESYVFRAYESTLNSGEQYVYLSNDNDSQNNQGIIRQILGLVLGNTRVKNQVYLGDNLATANLVSYANASDCQNDLNPIHTYSIEATYTDGKLTGYQSKEI